MLKKILTKYKSFSGTEFSLILKKIFELFCYGFFNICSTKKIKKRQKVSSQGYLASRLGIVYVMGWSW